MVRWPLFRWGRAVRGPENLVVTETDRMEFEPLQAERASNTFARPPQTACALSSPPMVLRSAYFSR